MKKTLTLLVAGFLLCSTASSEHPKPEHPKPEHPKKDSEHPKRSEHPQAAKSEKATVVGVLLYADWCASCKVLEPKLEAIKGDFEKKPIQFTRLDLTNAATRDKSARHAEKLGLSAIYETNKNRTGVMLLVDARTKNILQELTHNQSEGQLRGAINSALAGTTRPEHPTSEHPRREHPGSSEHPRPEHPSRSERPQ